MSSYEDIRAWIQEGLAPVAPSALRPALELAEQGNVDLEEPSLARGTLELDLSTRDWASLRTVTVTRDEDGMKGLLLNGHAGTRQIDDREAAVSLGLAPEEWQKLRAATETGLDQLAAGRVWNHDRGVYLRFESGATVAEKYAAAVERGSQHAAMRLHELGVDPAEVAAGVSTVPDDVKAILRREGMEATDRGQNSVGSLSCVVDLEAQAENLAAHPWDQGSARQLVLEQIDIQVQAAAADRQHDLAEATSGTTRPERDELTTAISYQEVEADSATAQQVWAVVEDVSRHSVHRRDATAAPALAGLRAVRRESVWTAVTIVRGDRATEVSVYEASTSVRPPTAKDRLLSLEPATSPAAVAHNASVQHREVSR